MTTAPSPPPTEPPDESSPITARPGAPDAYAMVLSRIEGKLDTLIAQREQFFQKELEQDEAIEDLRRDVAVLKRCNTMVPGPPPNGADHG